ncbi:MAG: rhomboid family intramembrane serine protease [Myxococcota bacterium]|nr:rhomboid family intramembrane serine protease [Myxococcota bacterium]
MEAWRRTPFTVAVVSIAVVTTGIQLLVPSLRERLGLIPEAFLYAGRAWQIVTYSFVYVGLIHLVWFSAPALASGFVVEPRLGSRRTGLLFFASVTVAGVIHLLASPWDALYLGGGAGLFGLMAAFSVLWWPRRSTSPSWHLLLVVWFGLAAIGTLSSPASVMLGRLAGAAIGGAIAWRCRAAAA